MNNKGLVSVIMPVFNGMPFLKASLCSLLDQTYSNWECVIINDGSTDNTRTYLDALTDSRFLVCHLEKNRGRPQARQKGLALSSGEYIAMLDADDMYHPDKLNIQVDVMNRHPDIYLVGAGMCSFGSNVDCIRIRGKGDGKSHMFYSHNPFPVAHAPSMLRREHAVKFSYNPALKFGQDVDYLRRYLNGKLYINLPHVLYYYSEFDSVTKKKILSSYKLCMINFFKESEYLNALEYVAKLIYGYTVYPFLNINKILARRGYEPTQREVDEFRTFVLKKIEGAK